MSTPSFTVPISQLPYGVVPTIAALRTISVATISDGATVDILGSGVSNDGYQGTYFFSGASVYGDNGSTIIGTPTTGSWIKSTQVPYIPTLQVASYSGIGETFVILSGGASQVIYTLPPSYTMFGQTITIKSLSTGAFQIRATGADSIFPTTGNGTVAFINLQNTGTSFGAAIHFQAAPNIYYQV